MLRIRSFLPLAAAALVGAGLLGAPNSAKAEFIRLDFSSNAGGGIVIDPTNVGAAIGTVHFNPGTVGAGTGTMFQVTNSTGVGDSVGLFGDITGTYNVNGPIVTAANGDQTASVVDGAGATHQVVIHDGLGNNFVADVDWINIKSSGAIGGLNAQAVVNLTNVSYAGTNADLAALATLAGNTRGTAVISFQLASNANLHTLFDVNTSPVRTSFSGSLTATPAPAGLVLLCLGGASLGLGGLVRRWRSAPMAA